MGFRKLLGIILIIVISVFGLMLTTSYAWYSYENASTKFDVVTANDNVEVIFQKGEFINTESAIPIKSFEVDRYADKYDFNIKVGKNVVGNDMIARISLVNIEMDYDLRKVDPLLGDSPFRVDLFYQGRQVGTSISGANISSSSLEFGDVILSGDVDNQFEFRVYLLDNGDDQSYLMNKIFQAKIDINVVSRVSTSVKSFEDADIEISNIVIDGRSSKSLPVSGVYDMNFYCEKGSNLLWDSYSRSLIYDKGSFVHDSCKLEFVSSIEKKYLNEVSVGSYVSYVGNNGCDKCDGENVNYVDKDDMGYCSDGSYHFSVSGFRVAYLSDETAYLVSAGAVECVSGKNIDSLEDIVLKYCNSSYIYNGICDSESVHLLNSNDIEKMSYGDLVDNGGYYFYYDNNKNDVFSWNPVVRNFDTLKDFSYGVRPVIRLDSSIYVVSGSGTFEDPYIISK